MITATMTDVELMREFDKHRLTTNRFLYHRMMELYKLCRKTRSDTASRSIVRDANGMRYLLVYRYHMKGDILFTCWILVFCEETNEWLEDDKASPYMRSFTTHYFKRYALRALGRDDMAIKDIALEHALHNDSTQIEIYNSGCEFVFATKQGINICEYDSSRHILVFKTFVSMDMLGRCQRAAVYKVEKALNDIAERRKKARSSAKTFYECEKVPEEYWLTIDEADAIYRQYFEEKGK